MPSRFSWLDFSERDRRLALNTIDLFRDKTTRDELGLGTIRDAIADVLFPGTSTIQTRARYFLFVPWLYRELEKRQVAAGDVARLARQMEIRLIDALAQSEDIRGVIGIEARGSLQRLPSSVYWQGLGDWGIRQMPISISEYHRHFAQLANVAGKRNSIEEEDLAIDSRIRPMWHAGLPAAPPDFPGHASMALTADESDYLRERILTRASGTMLAAMLGLPPPPDDERSLPWEYSCADRLPGINREQLAHARRFAMVTLGGPLLYNLLLSELKSEPAVRDKFREWIRLWAQDGIAPMMADLRSWDREAFWRLVRSTYPRLGLPTRRFSDQWIDLVLTIPSVERIADDEHARHLVRSRERSLKGPLSRFVSEKSLALWNGESGTGIANYRWHRVIGLVRDISRSDGDA